MEGKKEASVTSKWKGREENGTLELCPLMPQERGWGGKEAQRAATGLLEGSVLNAYVVGRWVLDGQ